MNKLTLLLAVLLSFYGQLSAQENNNWTMEKKHLLFEKLYLHIDRELYAPGDPIWFKAYQVNGITHQLNSNYRNIYVQLIDDKGKSVNDLLLFSLNGQALGCFKTDSLPEGMYTIHAFTKYLEHFGEEALFNKRISINKADPLTNLFKKDTIDYSSLEVAFLPEGGNMVMNASNTIAFKAINKKGRGVPVSGQIIDEKGDTITSFKSLYRGMGKFTLLPMEGKTYYALIDQNSNLKIPLPNAVSDGVNLSCKDMGQSLCFTLSINPNLDKEYLFYLNVTHKATSLTRIVHMEDDVQSLCLDKELFPQGISKVTVLDSQKNPLAERLVYVDKKEINLLTFQLDKKEYEPREKVTMNVNTLLAEGDSITSEMSLNVVNESYFGTDGNSQDIRSYLLLDAELKGGIEAPASFFTDDKIPSSQKLDLLMMVNGWRSYLWDEVSKTEKIDSTDWNDAGIEVKGYVKKLLWNAPIADAELDLGYVFKIYSLGKAMSDKNGRFSFEKTFFYDSTQVMINGRTKQGSRSMEIKLDTIIHFKEILSPSLLKKQAFPISLSMQFYEDNALRRQKELAFSPEKGSILLNGVDIKSKKTRAFSRSWGDYPWADKTFTITPKDYRFMYVTDYLEYYLPALVRHDAETYYLGNNPVVFKLDNVPSDIRELNTVPMKDIDLIDIVMPHWNNFIFESLGTTTKVGMIVVYQKVPFQVHIEYNKVKGRIRPAIRGYQRTPRFYSPSYTPENINDPKPDYRPTLLWDPELSFKDNKASVEFFTSDELARYVVFVEGITKNGKICYGTTSFKVDKR